MRLHFDYLALGSSQLFEQKVFYDSFLQDNRITKLQYKFTMAIAKHIKHQLDQFKAQSLSKYPASLCQSLFAVGLDELVELQHYI